MNPSMRVQASLGNLIINKLLQLELDNFYWSILVYTTELNSIIKNFKLRGMHIIKN